MAFRSQITTMIDSAQVVRNLVRRKGMQRVETFPTVSELEVRLFSTIRVTQRSDASEQ